VHGCFWHQHPGCNFAYMPSSNTKFWREKLGSNRTRDARNSRALARLGWRLFVVWECEVADQSRLARLLSAIGRKR
jgi:DNA mismatch endonuclease (patch repair protein)